MNQLSHRIEILKCRIAPFAMTLFAVCNLTAILSHADDGWQEHPNATYEVPVSDNLKSLAVFPLLDLKTREKDGQWIVHYSLPLELTGRKIEIQVSAPANDKTVGAGENSKMVCDQAKCALTYKDLNLSAKEVEGYLRSLKIAENEVTLRLEVFQSFVSGDPAGIIHFKY